MQFYEPITLILTFYYINHSGARNTLSSISCMIIDCFSKSMLPVQCKILIECKCFRASHCSTDLANFLNAEFFLHLLFCFLICLFLVLAPHNLLSVDDSKRDVRRTCQDAKEPQCSGNTKCCKYTYYFLII